MLQVTIILILFLIILYMWRKINELKWIISNAHAYVYNITPNRDVSDLVSNLDDQISILDDKLNNRN